MITFDWAFAIVLGGLLMLVIPLLVGFIWLTIKEYKGGNLKIKDILLNIAIFLWIAIAVLLIKRGMGW